MALPRVGDGYQIGTGSSEPFIYQAAAAPPVKTGAGTLTVDEFVGGLVQTNFGSALALTTPTAAQIDAAYPNLKVGSSFGFTLAGTAAFANTLTMGTGMTAVGANATPATTIASAQWRVTKTSAVGAPPTFNVIRTT